MAIRISDSTSSFQQINQTSQKVADSLERISSGRKINRAADNSAGLVIADSLASQARGFGQAIRNASDAISITQVAEGALGQSTEIVQNIRNLAIQAANDSQSLNGRRALQAEIDRSLATLNDIAQTTTYNGQRLLNGAFTNKAFQVGATGGETVTISIPSAEASQLGGGAAQGSIAGINVLTQEGAQAAIGLADEALNQLNASRAGLGANQNQLAASISNLEVGQLNALSAESEMRDVDLAEESMNLTQANLLLKAQSFASTQSFNVNKKNLMSLLQG